MYYLRAIYEDGSTRLGTFANRTFGGRDISRVIQSFKKQWSGVVDRGSRIIGVEVEQCLRKYDEGTKTRILFNNEKREEMNDNVFT